MFVGRLGPFRSSSSPSVDECTSIFHEISETLTQRDNTMNASELTQPM